MCDTSARHVSARLAGSCLHTRLHSYMKHGFPPSYAAWMQHWMFHSVIIDQVQDVAQTVVYARKHSLARPGVAAVVGYPSTSMVSFTASGKPHRGVMVPPEAALASIAAASASTCTSTGFRQGFETMRQLAPCSCSMQGLYCLHPSWRRTAYKWHSTAGKKGMLKLA